MRSKKTHKKNPAFIDLIDRLESRYLLSAAFDITGLTALRNDAAFSSITGSGVGIAVLDTGVDAANPELTPQVEAFYNAVEDPVSTTSTAASGAVDNDGHGTHVSGIAASSNPSIGVAYGAKLVDIKVIADSGESQLGGDPVLRGLEWVAANYQTYNIKVVNMSLGESGVNDNTVTTADAQDAEAVEIQTLQKLGITVVTAAGNSYAQYVTAGESFPAIVSTIAVGNTWATTGQASDFNVPFGQEGDTYYAVDYSATPDTLASTSQRSSVGNMILAPGEDIYSDWNGTLDSSNGSDLLHNTISGTSMATPFISGVVALMQQAADYFGGHYLSSPTQILQIIQQTADTVVDSNNPNNARYDSQNGSTSNLPETGLTFKRVDVLKAIQEVQQLVTGGSVTIGPAPGPDTDNTTTTATPVNSIDGTTVYTFDGNIGNDGLVEVGANDVDLYQLNVVSTGQMTFTLSLPTSGTAGSLVLRLFDGNGNVLASAVGTASSYPTLTTNGALAVGTYYLGISSAGNINYTVNGTGAAGGTSQGDYALQITLVNPDPNGTIQGAVAVDLTEPTESLTDSNTGLAYTDVLEQGQLGSDPPPTGSTTRITVSSDVDMFKVTAPDNGTLDLTAVSGNFSGNLTFMEVFDANGNSLKTSTSNTNSIDSENDLSLAITAGDTYYVAVTVPANSGFNPTNPYLGRTADATPSNQAYNLHLRFDNNDTNGTALDAVNGAIGTAVNGVIGTDNGVTVGATGSKDVDWLAYTASSSGIFDVTAQSTTDGFTPVITLWEYAAGGSNIVKVADTSSSTLFASSASAFASVVTTSSGNPELLIQVAAGQQFFVAITGQGNSNFNWYAVASGTGGQTGNYTLTTQLQPLSALKALNDNSVNNGTPETISVGQTVNGVLGADGSLVIGPTDVDLYQFVAPATETIDIRTYTNQEGDADTVLRVFNSSGTQLAANDNINSTTTASDVMISVTQGQTYYIGVDGAGTNSMSYDPLTGDNAGSGSTGKYSLSVSAVLPAISIASPPALSANVGGNLVFTVTLSQASNSSTTVDYATSDGTAAAGTDYTAQSGTLTFSPGVTSQTISVPVAVNNSIASGTRDFTLTLTNPANAILATATATGTIDEGSTVTPALSIASPAPAFAAAGGTLVFTVSLSQAASGPVTIDYATADGTAAAGTDYTAESGTLAFAPGVTTQTVSVPVLVHASSSAGSLQFSLTLSNPSGATLTWPSATGTITEGAGTTLSFSPGKPAHYTDSLHHLAELVLAGPGSGTALFETGSADPVQIVLNNTTAASAFSIVTPAALVPDILVNGSLRSLTAASTTLTGDLTISGAITRLTLGTVSGSSAGSAIAIGAAGSSTISLGIVTNESLSTSGTIAALSVDRWINNTGGALTIDAASIGTLTSRGDFAASVATGSIGTARILGSLTSGTWNVTSNATSLNVTGAVDSGWNGVFGGLIRQVRFGSDAGQLSASSIIALTISSNLSNAVFNLTGSGQDIGTLLVARAVTGTQINSAGSIGRVTVGSFLQSDLLVGLQSSVAGLPTAASNFATSDAILSFVVTANQTPYSFADSIVAAEKIGSVIVGRVNPSNGGTPFGFATGSLNSFTDRGVETWTSRKPASALNFAGDFKVNVLG